MSRRRSESQFRSNKSGKSGALKCVAVLCSEQEVPVSIATDLAVKTVLKAARRFGIPVRSDDEFVQKAIAVHGDD
jgi:hypothetical protein